MVLNWIPNAGVKAAGILSLTGVWGLVLRSG